jgi:hypothetical protein
MSLLVQLPDAVHPHYFKDMTVTNVAPDGLIKMAEPLEEWRNESDCGEATYKRDDGSVVKLNCAGPRRAFFKDVDGSLLGGLAGNSTMGKPGTTLHGGWREPRHTSGYDQGTTVVSGTCSLETSFTAYQCRQPGVEGTVSLTSGYQQAAPPPMGLFGQPELFIIESRDRDSEDRNFGPVIFESAGALSHPSEELQPDTRLLWWAFEGQQMFQIA